VVSGVVLLVNATSRAITAFYTAMSTFRFELSKSVLELRYAGIDDRAELFVFRSPLFNPIDNMLHSFFRDHFDVLIEKADPVVVVL